MSFVIKLNLNNCLSDILIVSVSGQDCFQEKMVLPSDHHIYTVNSPSLCGLYDILLQDQQFSGTVCIIEMGSPRYNSTCESKHSSLI